MKSKNRAPKILTIKLRSFKTTEEASTSASIKARNNRQNVQAYRDRLRKNEESWDEYKSQKNEYMRKYRRNANEEQKQKFKESSKMRMRKYRESLKSKEKDISKTAKRAPKITTRGETSKIQEQREYWRKNQSTYRSKLTAQKKRRIREKDRKTKQDERNKNKVVSCHEKDIPATSASNLSDSAKRKLASRARKVLPSSPNKFATVVDHLVANSSPACQKIIRRRLGNKQETEMQHKENTIKCLTNAYKSLKRNTREERVSKKTVTVKLAQEVKKKYGITARAISKTLGIHPTYMANCAAKTGLSSSDLHKRKKRKDRLSLEVTNSVRSFYERDYVSTQLPNKKDVSKKTLLAKRVLNRSIDETYKMWREEYSNDKLSFSKFASLRPKHVVSQCKRQREQCLCEYCENIQLKLDQINNFTNRFCPESRLGDVYAANSVSLCTKVEGRRYNDLQCIERNCSKCGVHLISSKLEPLLLEVTEMRVEWARWETVKENQCTKKTRVVKSGSVKDMVDELKAEMQPFSQHLFTADWQRKQCGTLCREPQNNSVVMVMDFSQNFACSFQREVQSAHWSQTQVTLHPVVAYYKCPEDGQTVKEAIHVISNDRVHDNHSVACFVQVIIQHLRDDCKVHFDHCIQFTDGCGRQYKSGGPFADISYSKEDLNCQMDRNFFGSRHGKSDSDGEGGVVKSAVTRAVTSEEAVITDALSFYNYCHSHLCKGLAENHHECSHFKRSFIYVDTNDIKRRRSATSREVKTVKGTRKLHCIRSVTGGIINTRKLSCYCSGCSSNEECQHRDYVDTWTLVDLQIQAEDNTKDLEMPETSDADGQGQSSNAVIEDAQTSDECLEQTPPQSPVCSTKVGDFVAVAVTGKKRKVTYIARVMDIDHEEIKVTYLQASGSSSQSYSMNPDESSYWHPSSDVLGVVGVPEISGTGSRLRLTFSKTNLKKYMCPVQCIEP